MPRHFWFQTLKSLVIGEVMEDDSAAFFLLSGANLQKWCISSDGEKVRFWVALFTCLSGLGMVSRLKLKNALTNQLKT